MDNKDDTTTSETDGARLGTDSHNALEEYSNKILQKSTGNYRIAQNFQGSKFLQIASKILLK